MELDPQQALAVELCCDLTKRLVAVTGEAGTGKTTIIKTVADRFTENGIRFAIAAPTGKAARRIREATGYPAVTLHKLLEFNKPKIDEDTGDVVIQSLPSRTKDNPLDIDFKVVIVDEYAMVNVSLHRDLVSALGTAQLRLFGDVRQLPPIEEFMPEDYKSPFQKCLEMQNSIRLDKVFRQAEGNGILEAARLINRGHRPERNAEYDVRFSESMIGKLYDEVKKDPQAWGSLRYQIISPGRKSQAGTMKLNAGLQAIINPSSLVSLTLPRHKWDDKDKISVSVGDKVVCTSNCYDLRDWHERFAEWQDPFTPVLGTFIPTPDTAQMLNGEIGIIENIDDEGALEINFGDRVVRVPPKIEEYLPKEQILVHIDNRKNIDLAYALTTHKCQGSEYDVVAYVIANALYYNLCRPNFYTAVTRAKQKVIVFSDLRGYTNSLAKLKSGGPTKR